MRNFLYIWQPATKAKDIDLMDLIDRARRFVKGGKLTELLPLLRDCVATGNTEGMLAVKLLARDMYGGETYNWELKAPAAYCLLAWGESGLEALVENALKEPTPKNFSLAFLLLASAAEGNEPQSNRSWLSDRQLREAVSRAVNGWSDLAPTARSHLNELMLSIEDDNRAARYAGTSLIQLAVQDHGAVRNLSHALSLRSIAVGPSVLAAYNDLLAGTGDDESAFQHFFKCHPLLLDPRAFQVWGKPDFHGKLEPDFIIRTYDNAYVIVEIETPAKLLVTQQNQLSAHATHAISQVLKYQEYLRTHLTAALDVFPKFTTAAGLVVVGRESSLDPTQRTILRSENQSRPGVRIVGFDALADSAKAVTSNVIHGIPKTISHARLP